ncbi:MAG: HD domain-containing protein, partial [Planctomycetota bacterium]
MAMDDIEPYATFARPFYADKDPAHDFRHIERILGRLDALGKGMSPPPRPHRLHFLACFHGLGIRLRNDRAFRERVREFLGELGWSEVEADRGFACLWRHLEDPVTVEEKIVRDANYVELLGAFGVAKAFVTGGARGQSLEETAE